MREIKFRGKRLDNGEWVYGSLLQGETAAAIACVGGDTLVSLICEVNPDTVGLFTGLHDYNGKEIYEGDIIKDSQHRYEVCWYDDVAAFMAEDMITERPFLATNSIMVETKIIGNIHDNPELLKQ